MRVGKWIDEWLVVEEGDKRLGGGVGGKMGIAESGWG
jgi:hypothetical protein